MSLFFYGLEFLLETSLLNVNLPVFFCVRGAVHPHQKHSFPVIHLGFALFINLFVPAKITLF